MNIFARTEYGMDLLLWRHAEAVDGIPDKDRPLTARGEKQARAMAKWLRANAPKHLRVVASPAKRTQQTAAALELPFETSAQLAVGANVADLLAVASWPDGMGKKYGGVLLVGHQPTLGQLAALLLSGSEAEWSIKKGGLWWFTNRVREGESQTVLRAVIAPDLLD